MVAFILNQKKAQTLVSSSSSSRASEASHCEINCNVLLRIKLLFNDVRCHKINIPFLPGATYRKLELVRVCKHTYAWIHTRADASFFLFYMNRVVVWAFASGSSYLKNKNQIQLKCKQERRKKERKEDWEWKHHVKETRSQKQRRGVWWWGVCRVRDEGRSLIHPNSQTGNLTPDWRGRTREGWRSSEVKENFSLMWCETGGTQLDGLNLILTHSGVSSPMSWSVVRAHICPH